MGTVIANKNNFLNINPGTFFNFKGDINQFRFGVFYNFGFNGYESKPLSPCSMGDGINALLN